MDQLGYKGCLRNLIIDRHPQKISSFIPLIANRRPTFGCSLAQYCSPNPCKNNGKCSQGDRNFYCNCEGTGYSGALCHSSRLPRSCTHMLQDATEPTEMIGSIDFDGYGPISPAIMHCKVNQDGEIVTIVLHDNVESTIVDGFQEKGSFYQNINYDVPEIMMKTLIHQSSFCYQSLVYHCKGSRLFDSSVPNYGSFDPYGWWVSGKDLAMDYWPGGYPGSRQCSCGMAGSCHDPYRGCNCDSNYLEWLSDGGNISIKEHLPVRGVHFGDTGTPLDGKVGRFELGPLVCGGDEIFQQIIDILPGAFKFEIKTERSSSSELFFEFRTSLTENVKLIEIASVRKSIFKLSLVNSNSLMLEWKRSRIERSFMVSANYNLTDGKWHSVLFECSSVEVRMVLDFRFESVASKVQHWEFLNGDLVFLGEKVCVIRGQLVQKIALELVAAGQYK